METDHSPGIILLVFTIILSILGFIVTNKRPADDDTIKVISKEDVYNNYDISDLYSNEDLIKVLESYNFTVLSEDEQSHVYDTEEKLEQLESDYLDVTTECESLREELSELKNNYEGVLYVCFDEETENPSDPDYFSELKSFYYDFSKMLKGYEIE